MQSFLSYGLLAGLGMELLLAFGLICFMMKKSKIPHCLQSKLVPLPVCQSEKCRQLETVMLDYMEKELDFKDTSTELAAVITHLKEQEELIHNQGSVEARHRSLMQCLRTTLVNHPDDLRGRRRANKARQILINYVYKQGDCFFYAEEKAKNISNFLWDNLATCFQSCLPPCMLVKDAKRKLLKTFSYAETTISIMKAAAIWALDVYSDVSVMTAIWFVKEQIYDLRGLSDADLPQIQYLTKSCNITDVETLDAGLSLLGNIFSQYFKTILIVFCITAFIQAVKSLRWKLLYSDKGLLRFQNWHKLLAFFLVTPFTIIAKMWKTQSGLKDPLKERNNQVKGNFTQEMSEHRIRNIFKIVEAFSESLASSRIQISFYLAFAFVIGQTEKYKYLDCIAQTLLNQDKSIFTIYERGWHGMPILAFSALMSLISISTAQFSVYTTRHEFDTTILGKIVYLLSALLGTFVKLSVHVMFFTVILIPYMDPENTYPGFLVFTLPQAAVYYLQLQVISCVDWWMANGKDCGYSLQLQTGFIWPTTSNTFDCLGRVRALNNHLKALNEQKEIDSLVSASKVDQGEDETDKENEEIEIGDDPIEKEEGHEKSESIWERARGIVIWYRALWRQIRQMMTREHKTPLWYSSLLFPWMGLSPPRLSLYADQFGFKDKPSSRKKYQRRFTFALGKHS